MKTNEKKTDDKTVPPDLLAVLEKFGAEQPPIGLRTHRALEDGDEKYALKLFTMQEGCSTCHKKGYVEDEEAVNVPPIVIRRNGQAGFQHGPKVTVRERCAACEGRGWHLSPMGVALVGALLSLVHAEDLASGARSIDEHNARARKDLAEKTRVHEEKRAREEAAAKIEAEATDRAKAIRGGADRKTTAEVTR